jgi:isoleucyl-tRNA synthetase
MVPVLDDIYAERLSAIEDLIRSEVNVKELEIIRDGGGIVKSIKPDFKALGPRYGKRMKAIAAAINALPVEATDELESEGKLTITPDDGQGEVDIVVTDVQISTEDIPGWIVSSEGGLTVALDITIDAHLRAEGLSRELVNRVQNVRKDIGLEVTDRISLVINAEEKISSQLQENLAYIRTQTLAESVEWKNGAEGVEIELEDGLFVTVQVVKY